VLDEKREWKIVVFPYEKFFNFNESFAAKLDWDEHTIVTEKSDGSLMTLYYYDGSVIYSILFQIFFFFSDFSTGLFVCAFRCVDLML
jgi:hypothetical protein